MMVLVVALLALSVAAIPVAAQEREPDLKTVLRRAADYATEYHAQLSSMVAEECKSSAPARSCRRLPR